MIERQDPQRSDAESPGDQRSERVDDHSAAVGSVGKAIMDALPIGVIVLDRDATVIEVNAYAHTLLNSDDLISANKGTQAGLTLPENCMPIFLPPNNDQ